MRVFLLSALVRVLVLESGKGTWRSPMEAGCSQKWGGSESLPSKGGWWMPPTCCLRSSFNCFLSCDVTSLLHYQTFTQMLYTKWLCVSSERWRREKHAGIFQWNKLDGTETAMRNRHGRVRPGWQLRWRRNP